MVRHIVLASVLLAAASRVGFNVRAVAVEYDVNDQKLSCLGRSAKLAAVDGRIDLHILVDRLSIEVFANDGAVSMTYFHVFDPKERSVQIFEITGIGAEPGVERQDPSNVIKVGDVYYVWYTRRKAGVHAYASTVYYAASKDGWSWTEKGEALGKGAPDAWDSFGVITPYVAVFDGKYYLYYTGTHAPNGFRNRDPNGTKRHIGVAVADNPNEPWKRFEGNPVLSPGKEGMWDELLVDDTHVIVRDGKYWLYYKGGHGHINAYKTQWGVAIADRIRGPYRKHEANPLVYGHCVCLATSQWRRSADRPGRTRQEQREMVGGRHSLRKSRGCGAAGALIWPA